MQKYVTIIPRGTNLKLKTKATQLLEEASQTLAGEVAVRTWGMRYL